MSSTFQEQWVCERSRLRRLLTEQPNWSTRQLAQATGHSKTWVKVWKKRLSSNPADELLLLGKSHAPHKAPPPPDPLLGERVLALRTELVAIVGRIPGPKTLLYYLAQDPVLKEKGVVPPHSTSTVYKLMLRQGCYDRPGLKKASPTARLEPLECIAGDFKDVVTVEIDPEGKNNTWWRS